MTGGTGKLLTFSCPAAVRNEWRHAPSILLGVRKFQTWRYQRRVRVPPSRNLRRDDVDQPRANSGLLRLLSPHFCEASHSAAKLTAVMELS